MKTLIIYGSRYGTTKECARMLEEKLEGDLNVVNVKEVSDISLEQYERIILGSSVYIGNISKELKEFIQRYLYVLKEKRIGIFMCCGMENEIDTVFERNYPAELLKAAKSRKVFGGEARIGQMSFFDKMITKAALGKKIDSLAIHQDRIAEFVEEMS